MFRSRLLFFFSFWSMTFFAFLPASSYAAWLWNGSYSSPEAACEGIGRQNAVGDYPVFISSRTVNVSPPYGGCYATYSTLSGGSTRETYFGLSAVQVADPEPQPEENKCALLANTDIPAFRWESSSDNPPESVSIGGCEAKITKAKCWYDTSGKAWCTGSATITGQKKESTPGGTSEECEGDECTAGALKPTKETQDCVYSPDGTGKSSCTAVNKESSPGNSSCGTVNGSFVCIENPKATSTKSTLESVKTEKSNTDGTVTIIKDNTLTVEKCTGKSCSTSTSTSKGTTTVDSSGKTTGNQSTCTGSNCNGSGETNGTGDENKAGEEEGEEEGDGPSVTAPEAPEKGNLDGEGDKWDQKIQESKTEMKEALSDFKEAFNPIGEVSLDGGGALYCPPAVTVLGQNIDFCLDKYSDTLSWLGSAIYMLCAAIALFIVFA